MFVDSASTLSLKKRKQKLKPFCLYSNFFPLEPLLNTVAGGALNIRCHNKHKMNSILINDKNICVKDKNITIVHSSDVQAVIQQVRIYLYKHLLYRSF
jgi:hypothetical protein